MRACSELRHCDILTGVAAASALVSCHIAVVHLVDNNLCGVYHRAHILAPALRVGVAHINDSTAVAINIQCACKDTRCLLQCLTLDSNLEGVVHTLFIALYVGIPKTVVTLGHSHLFGEHIAIIEAYYSTIGRRCP